MVPLLTEVCVLILLISRISLPLPQVPKLLSFVKPIKLIIPLNPLFINFNLANSFVLIHNQDLDFFSANFFYVSISSNFFQAAFLPVNHSLSLSGLESPILLSFSIKDFPFSP